MRIDYLITCTLLLSLFLFPPAVAAETNRKLIQSCVKAIKENETEKISKLAPTLMNLELDYPQRQAAIDCLEAHYGRPVVYSFLNGFQFTISEEEKAKWSPQLSALINEARFQCSQENEGVLQVPIDAVQSIDLNNDQIMDEILNFGLLKCSSSNSMWSGSGGSWRALIVDNESTQFLAKSLAVTFPFGDYPIVSMLVHGSLCGQAGVVDCVFSTVWSNGKFQTLE